VPDALEDLIVVMGGTRKGPVQLAALPAGLAALNRIGGCGWWWPPPTPGKLPWHSTWYLVTDLSRPTGPGPYGPTLPEVAAVRLRNWVEQGYKQGRAGLAGLPGPLGPGDPPALALVCCAFSFCWQALLAEQPANRASNSQAGAGRQKLLDDGDELALGVPFAEIPQCLGHLAQPIATVDDRSDLSCLAEPNQRRQALRT
jgi:hypothetical protein